MKFLVPNYSCLQNPRLWGYCPQILLLSVLCPQLNLLNPPPQNKIPGCTTGLNHHFIIKVGSLQLRALDDLAEGPPIKPTLIGKSCGQGNIIF
jgi:hypothetical protein